MMCRKWQVNHRQQLNEQLNGCKKPTKLHKLTIKIHKNSCINKPKCTMSGTNRHKNHNKIIMINPKLSTLIHFSTSISMMWQKSSWHQPAPPRELIERDSIKAENRSNKSIITITSTHHPTNKLEARLRRPRSNHLPSTTKEALQLRNLTTLTQQPALFAHVEKTLQRYRQNKSTSENVEQHWHKWITGPPAYRIPKKEPRKQSSRKPTPASRRIDIHYADKNKSLTPIRMKERRQSPSIRSKHQHRSITIRHKQRMPKKRSSPRSPPFWSMDHSTWTTSTLTSRHHRPEKKHTQERSKHSRSKRNI